MEKRGKFLIFIQDEENSDLYKIVLDEKDELAINKFIEGYLFKRYKEIKAYKGKYKIERDE